MFKVLPIEVSIGTIPAIALLLSTRIVALIGDPVNRRERASQGPTQGCFLEDVCNFHPVAKIQSSGKGRLLE